MMSWTVVVAMALASVAESSFVGSGDLIPFAVFLIILLAAATCIPFLVDRLLDAFQYPAKVVPFSTFWQVWLVIFVGLYSMLMFGLSAIAFEAEWKGSKGLSWVYYTLDHKAALTWWPSYIIGGIAFIYAVVNRKFANRSPVLFLMIVIQALISFAYTFACLFMNFAPPRGFWLVPGSCAICYSLFAALIFCQRTWSLETVRAQWIALSATLIGFVVGIFAKYPFAAAYYQQLADEPPDDCFIVSAASKGSQSLVGSWFDAETGRVLNQQLISFWQFEDFLKERFPAFHSRLRKVYNRVGPVLARQIVFNWQANLVYCLLKPLELVTKVIVSVASK